MFVKGENMKIVESHFPIASTRRDFLARAANGFGSLALSHLLSRDANALGVGQDRKLFNPLGPRQPHFTPKAKAVIFLYMVGAPSQMETFDPKPTLSRLHGQQLPPSFGEIKSQFIKPAPPLWGSAWKYKKHGKSGTEAPDLF